MGSCCGNDNTVLDEMETDGENYTSLDGFKRIRSCTDRIPLIGMGVFFGLLFVFIAVAIANGDISRFVNGYDDCGNVCGKNNIKPKDSPFNCFGEDMTDKKYLLMKLVKNRPYNYTTKECVHDCKAEGGFILFLNRCFMKSHTNSNVTEDIDVGGNFLQNVSEDFQQVWGQIILMSILALVFSIIMVFLLRYATAFVVWFVLLGMTAVLLGGSIFLWILYIKAKDAVKASGGNLNKEGNRDAFLWLAIFATIFTVLILIVMVIFFKRIKLVIQLFKEAAKAVAAMPMLLFQPVWTFCALFIIFVCGSYFSMWITSYANLSKNDMSKFNHDNPDALTYEQTPMSWVTSGLNWFGILWMIQFAIGCQHMIVGGCVATWFFARNKDNLGSPIISNTRNLVKFHLGTVAFGSLIITIVEVIKQLVRSLRHSMNDKKNIVAVILLCIIGTLLEWLEAILKFFSRNAYIMTAIYGYPFCQGGKKAFKLLMNNIFSVVAINSVGDYVLTFMKIFIVLFTTLIGYEALRAKELHFIWVPLVVIGIIAFFIAHCFVTIFEMAIDTIFLCFCEDCEQNDGLSKPYYMSRNLMEFVENSSKVMKTPWEAEQLQAWENGPKRLLQQGS